jgi:hypothetical protein
MTYVSCKKVGVSGGVLRSAGHEVGTANDNEQAAQQHTEAILEATSDQGLLCTA